MRGFHPWPGAFTTFNGRQVKVLRAGLAEPGPGDPGVVIGLDGRGILVAGGEGTRLKLLEVQPESRRAMSAGAYAAGARIAPGARLGGP